MSPAFIQQFKNENPCRICPQTTASGRQFCARHLTIAKGKWMLYSISRRESGMCSYCHRKARAPGETRCKGHAEVNRVKCKAWHQAHPEAQKRAVAKKRQLKAAGLCMGCKEARPLPAPTKSVPSPRNCTWCRELRTATHNGNVLVVEAMKQERRSKRLYELQLRKETLGDKFLGLGVKVSK